MCKYLFFLLVATPPTTKVVRLAMPLRRVPHHSHEIKKNNGKGGIKPKHTGITIHLSQN
jgi:hypothetical protein